MPEVGNTADTPSPPWLLTSSNQGGFGVSAVLPTSSTQTFIMNYNKHEAAQPIKFPHFALVHAD